jgi:hypothetical protein
MKNISTAILLLLALTLFGCQTLAPGKTMPLKNPGFEEAANASPIPGWELSEHGGQWKGKAYEMAIDANAGSGSGRALRVTRLQDEVYGWVHQKVPVLPEVAGKKLTFSASMKTGNVGAEGWLLIVNMNGRGSIIQQFRSKPITDTREWRKADVTAVIPAGTSAVDVGFILLDAGTGWGDDAMLSIE